LNFISKKISLVIALGLVFSTMATANIGNAGTNNLFAGIDPGFETAAEGSIPASWNNILSISDTQKHSGKKSGFIYVDPTNKTGLNSDLGLNAGVNNNTSYRLSAWVKPVASKVNFSFGFKMYNKQFQVELTEASSQWVFLSYDFTTSTGAGAETPLFYLNTKSSVYIDDIALIPYTPTAPNAPTITTTITDRSTSVSGTGVKDSLIKVKLNGSDVAIAFCSVVTGKWKATIPKQKIGNVFEITCTRSGLSSTKVKVIVKPTSPSIAKFTSKSKILSGTTYPSTKVYLKVNTKSYTVKSDSTGKYKLILKSTIKKGKTISAYVKYSGQTSAKKIIKVS